MAFEPTKEQKNAIDANGLVLISAAAGSGKTAVLVERVIGKLCYSENAVDADRMLIVTFTNAAAAELRSRIEKRLLEEHKKDPENMRILRQMTLLPFASICTIDSFCISLIRENFQHFGISRNFKVGDKASFELVFSKAFNSVVAQYYEQNDPMFFTLLEAVGADYGDEALKTAVERIYNFSRSMPDPEEWLCSSVNLYNEATVDFEGSIWVNAILDNTYKEALFLERMFLNLQKEIIGDEAVLAAYGKFISNVFEFISKIKVALNEKDWDAVCRIKDEYGALKPSAVRNAVDEKTKTLAVAAKDRYSAFTEKLQSIFCADKKTQVEVLCHAGQIVSKLVEVVNRYSQEAEKCLLEENALTFDLAEHYTLNLLKEDSSISRELKQRYEEILVDEYQDTNNLQDAIFSYLSSDRGNLFMVGDVKQSIYGFRNANPENFLRRGEEYPEFKEGNTRSRVDLSGNFRSRKEICSFINEIFSKLMSRAAGGMEYKEREKLNPLSKKYGDAIGSAAELHIVEAVSDEKENGDVLEGRYIAEYILNAVKGEPFIVDGDTVRRPKFSDFAILMRSLSSHADRIASELNRRGIPVNLGGENLLETEEASAVISMLKIISNPTDDIAFATALMSVMFGFTPDEVAEIRLEKRNINLFSAARSYSEKDEKTASFLTVLDRLRVFSATLNVTKLIEKIYELTDISNSILVMENSELRALVLRMLLSVAGEYESNYDGGLMGFLRYIENTDPDRFKIPDVSDKNDAVKIMTIHSSKGLQFPICIVANLNLPFNKVDEISTLVVSQKGGIGLKFYDKEYNARLSSVSRTAISIFEEEKRCSEELRLLYVALTRAEEKLVLISSESDPSRHIMRLSHRISAAESRFPLDSMVVKKGNSYADWVLSAIGMREDYDQLDFEGREDVIFGVTPERESTQDYEEMPLITSEVDKSFEQIEQILGYEYEGSELKFVPAKAAASKVSFENKSVSREYKMRPGFMTKGGMTPAEKGTATHKFMQFADYTLAERDLTSEIERLYEYEFISREEADVVNLTEVGAFFASEIYQRIKNADKVFREYPFLSEVPAARFLENYQGDLNDTVIIQGVADCVFVESGEIVILDFKTDRIRDLGALAEIYRNQLEIYAEAIGKALNMPVKEKVIYSFFNKRAINLSDLKD